MKITVFGSTGSIGRQILPQALAIGHEVTAFTRDPARLADLRHPCLSVVRGDVLDEACVEGAVKGRHAVLCALGDGSKGRVRAAGTRSIVRAMERAGVRRLVCQTTLGAGESRGNLNFFWKNIMFGLLLREAFRDHEMQEKLVMESRLDWTIVRPAAFVDGEVTGRYRHGFAPADRTLALKISRADVALFMLMQLSTDEYLNKAPGLSY